MFLSVLNIIILSISSCLSHLELESTDSNCSFLTNFVVICVYNDLTLSYLFLDSSV